MRILFMGTAELACPSLEAVARLPEHQIVGVVTQPDRPKGRDLRPAPPPVKIVAQRLNLPVHQPEKIREPAALDSVRAARPDLIVIVAYGQILPKAVLDLPPRGCVNVHASLLPRWRGAAPIQYAILHGDRETGVTTMFINERMDAGDIILQRAEVIRSDDTAATLHDRLAVLGGKLIVETVALVAVGQPPRRPQDESQVTYAKKLTKDDGRIDWNKPALEIERQVRAFNPWPSAFTSLGDTMLKLWKVELLERSDVASGELRDGYVGTGHGTLRLVELQPAGGKRMSFEEFQRGRHVQSGSRLN
jgi:methionyl-tRNA formyltransferase